LPNNSLDHIYQAKELDINKNNNYQYNRHNPNKKITKINLINNSTTKTIH